MAKKLTSAKAKKILHDKTVHGKPLTDKQRKFFGAIAGGAEPYAQDGKTIYVSDPKDRRLKAYNDSLSLYNKFKGDKEKYFNFIKSQGFNPSYIEEWKPDGYIDKDIHPKIGAVAYGMLQNSGGGFERDKKGNAINFTVYPTNTGNDKKVIDDSELNKTIRKRYSVYAKPKQKVAYKKPEPKVEPKKEVVVPQPVLQTIPQPTQYTGTPIYAPTPYSPGSGAVVGFVNQGDTTYIKPEDYERMGVPNYGKEFIKRKKAQNGIEGTMGGLTDIGFNYNGAWGGQFQMGGDLIFLEPTSKKLTRGHVFPYQDPSTERATSIGGVGDEPAYLIPSFKYGKPLQDPEAEFKRTGEHLGGPFKTYQEADEWERTVRHPYVEKGQSIPTPLKRWGKDFAMGGSLPGATGMMYARTVNPAPSNGPYAKKTKASAQNGKEMQYYQEGLDWKPRNISQDGAIVDPMGQWAHPGQVTRIPSNNITMKGVDYPVLGVSNTGQTKMMFPERNYTFDGTYVTEYPMAQNGKNITKPTYNDSLLLYKNALEKEKFYKGNLDYRILDRQGRSSSLTNPSVLNKLAQESVKKHDEFSKRKDKSKIEQVLNPTTKNKNVTSKNITVKDIIEKTGRVQGSDIVYKAPDILGGVVDPYHNPDAPVILFSPQILPQGEIVYGSNIYGDSSQIPYYDSLAVKPYKMRTPQEKIEWEKKYGKKKIQSVPKQEIPVKKIEPPINKIEPPVEKKQNIYEGTPVYSPGAGSGLPSALVGFLNEKGDTTFIKPEDYERFAVPKYGKEYIEKMSKKLKNGGISVNMADEGSLKKLDQLTNFTNYNDMAKAKQGKKVKAQGGVKIGMPSAKQFAQSDYDITQQFNAQNPGANINAGPKPSSGNFGDMAGAAGMGLLQGLPQLIGGVETIIEQGKQKKQQKQLSELTGLAMQANMTRETRPRRYVRPEDILVQLGQMGSPYGTGTNFLAEDGTVIRNRIGGNPTEIQNMYNPGDLYMDLGYEPLRETDVKQFQDGGGVKFGDFFQASGQAQIGSVAGQAIGTALFGPLGGAAGQLIGTVGGNLLGGAKHAAEMRKIQQQNSLNQQQAAFSSAMQNQFGAYMEHGGDVSPYKWVSHTWQPQVITKFGEHKVSDLLKAPNDADMLRSGGHIRENYYFDTDAYPHSQNGSSTMGGDLQVLEGGNAETMSYNPFLPDGGETIMFRGRSHDNGGIPINYGENGVEVEGGEPAVKLEDGGTDKSLVVYGNMKINKLTADLMGDPKAKGQKFKNYVADISKNEAKQNKIIDKSTDLVRSADTNNPFDQLTMNSGIANITGALMKQRNNAMKKMNAAAVQSAILDTAEQLGKDSDALNEQVTSNVAAFGGKFSKAQDGTDIVSRMWKKRMPELFPNPVQTPYAPDYAKTLPDVTVSAKKKAPVGPETTIETQGVINYDQEETPAKGNAWENIAYGVLSNVAPFLRPGANKPLEAEQIAPELMSLAVNQLEPVQAQKFTPMLEQQYDISLQDQINAIDSQARAASRASGYNPAAQAQIMAEAARLKTGVLGEQLRINQGNRAQVAARNIEKVNQAQLQNLQILDQQYVRSAQAKSATKAQAIEAAKSIASKTLQNRLENRRLAVLQNMYNFRFTPSGVAYNVNAPQQFNIPTVVGGTENLTASQLRANTSLKADKQKARNGSIVKAIKNL